MYSVRKAWPARLVATVTTLALVFACTFATYAHVAGHSHSTRHAALGVEVHAAYAAHTETEPGQVAGAHGQFGHGHAGHERGGTDCSGTDCCNALCHGGHAILAAAPVMPSPVPGAPIVDPASALYSAWPSGLDRPPKTSVRA